VNDDAPRPCIYTVGHSSRTLEEFITIGFTKRTAAGFFGALKAAGIKQLIDVRLNNRSQLAGFTKRDDLAYFLREVCAADYCHEPLLAPTQEMLDAYKYAYQDDQFIPRRDAVERLSARMSSGARVILGMGLTRPMFGGGGVKRHWLQVNNIHIVDDPLWQENDN